MSNETIISYLVKSGVYKGFKCTKTDLFGMFDIRR